jgi:hypothetical protein
MKPILLSLLLTAALLGQEGASAVSVPLPPLTERVWFRQLPLLKPAAAKLPELPAGAVLGKSWRLNRHFSLSLATAVEAPTPYRLTPMPATGTRSGAVARFEIRF